MRRTSDLWTMHELSSLNNGYFNDVWRKNTIQFSVQKSLLFENGEKTKIDEENDWKLSPSDDEIYVW